MLLRQLLESPLGSASAGRGRTGRSARVIRLGGGGLQPIQLQSIQARRVLGAARFVLLIQAHEHLGQGRQREPGVGIARALGGGHELPDRFTVGTGWVRWVLGRSHAGTWSAERYPNQLAGAVVSARSYTVVPSEASQHAGRGPHLT